MWLPLNSTNECVIIINHQTFKFLIPQHTGTRIFISSEDALSLLLLFASPLAPFPPPQFAAVPLTSCAARGSGSTGSPPCPAGLSPELYAGFPEQPVTLPHLQGIPPSFLPSPTSLPFFFFLFGDGATGPELGAVQGAIGQGQLWRCRSRAGCSGREASSLLSSHLLSNSACSPQNTSWQGAAPHARAHSPLRPQSNVPKENTATTLPSILSKANKFVIYP